MDGPKLQFAKTRREFCSDRFGEDRAQARKNLAPLIREQSAAIHWVATFGHASITMQFAIVVGPIHCILQRFSNSKSTPNFFIPEISMCSGGNRLADRSGTFIAPVGGKPGDFWPNGG